MQNQMTSKTCLEELSSRLCSNGCKSLVQFIFYLQVPYTHSYQLMLLSSNTIHPELATCTTFTARCSMSHTCLSLICQKNCCHSPPVLHISALCLPSLFSPTSAHHCFIDSLRLLLRPTCVSVFALGLEQWCVHTGPASSFLVISDPAAAKHVLRASDNPKTPIYDKGLVAEVTSSRCTHMHTN